LCSVKAEGIIRHKYSPEGAMFSIEN